MGKTLNNLKWKPLWTSHIGCIKGCIDYLKMDISLPWIFGATGHAFIMNMHKLDCPSGPTAWNFARYLELVKNVGLEIDLISGFKKEEGFKDKQKKSWDMVKAALDKELPCYGWELNLPEFYIIHGYDDKGYYYSGACSEDGEGPKSWQEVGSSDLGWLSMFTGKMFSPVKSPRSTGNR